MSELIEIVQLLVDVLIEEKKFNGEDKQIITTEVSNHIYGNIKTKFGEKFIAAVECFEVEKDFEELSDSWRQLIQLKRSTENDITSLTRDDSPVTMQQIPLLLKDVISQQRLSKLRAFTEAVLHQRLSTQEQVSRLKVAINKMAPLAASPALLLNSTNLVLERPAQRLSAPAPTTVPPQQPAPSHSVAASTLAQTAPSGNVKQICASLSWQQYHSVYILDSSDLPGSSKIVGFDMDSTLIEPKSGRKFPANEHDWKWLFPEVPVKLKELYNTGHKIVIFTNQNGISKGNQDVNHLKKKILAMINEIEVPIQVFMASTEDEYRKPSTEMWHLMLRAHNHGVQPDLAQCLYVGDAAGRPAKGKRNKDFSAGDRKFAFNLKIGFKTESEFFLNAPTEEFEWDTFDVTAALNATSSDAQTQEKYTAEGQELVLMIGQPASGKSTFTKRHFASYVRVNQDTLLSKAKCWQEARNQLSAGRSVVIDNTNPSREARKVYLDMAREFNVPVRCFVFKTDDKLVQHLNAFRERTQGVKKIPKIAYAMFRKHYEEPVLSEGFKEIKFVPFTLKFDTPEEAELFKQFS